MAAELSKRGIPNSLLPENFSDDDIVLGKKDGTEMAFIQVKSCHPERSNTFILSENAEKWVNAHPIKQQHQKALFHLPASGTLPFFRTLVGGV